MVLKVLKQPQANKLELTERIDGALVELAPSLPKGISLHKKGFRQADFTKVAIRCPSCSRRVSPATSSRRRCPR